MAQNQNVLQLTQQTGSANITSVFYAVTGGNTDTGLPLSVFVNNLGLTGTPTTPTAVVGTSTTQIASCAFVINQAATVAPLMDGTATVGTSVSYARQDHIHPADTTRAALTGATFTGTTGIGYSTPVLFVNDTSGSNTVSLLFQNNGSTVWNLQKATGATGAFTVARYTSGTLVDTPISISNSTGLVSFVDGISPSTTKGIAGTTLADNANAGSVGELLTNAATGTNLTSTVVNNVVTLSLTAGDWDVSGTVTFLPAGTTTVSLLQMGLSNTSATLPAANAGAATLLQSSLTTGGTQIQQVGPVRFNVSTTTTIYLVADATFGVSTMQVNGFIRARRVR